MATKVTIPETTFTSAFFLNSFIPANIPVWTVTKELKTIVTKDVYENMQMSGFAWSLVLDKMRVNGKEKVIVSIIPDLQRRPTK